MDLVLAVVGLQSIARAGAAGVRGGARFAVWQRLIRGFMLSVDDVAQVARVAAKGKNSEAGEEESGANGEAAPLENALPSWRQRWGKGDWVAVGMAALCLLLLLITPLVTEYTPISALTALQSELHPFPAWSRTLE
jgi:hypothetical protein